MRPARRFATLHNSALSRLRRLRQFTNEAIQKQTTDFSYTNRELSFVSLELHSLICNFARSYYLSCILSPLGESGARVTCNPPIANYVDAIDLVMRVCKNRTWINAHGNKSWSKRDEPAWHLRATLLDSLTAIQCSNLPNVIAAYSLPTYVFEHLTLFRNFFAHRNESTHKLAQNAALIYSIPPNRHPCKILLSSAYNRPQELVLDWIDDVDNIIGLLCN